MPGAQAVVSALGVTSSGPNLEIELDNIQEEVKRVLPRLGRRQLQRLLVSIVETLYGGPPAGSSGSVPTFI